MMVSTAFAVRVVPLKHGYVFGEIEGVMQNDAGF